MAANLFAWVAVVVLALAVGGLCFYLANEWWSDDLDDCNILVPVGIFILGLAILSATYRGYTLFENGLEMRNMLDVVYVIVSAIVAVIVGIAFLSVIGVFPLVLILMAWLVLPFYIVKRLSFCQIKAKIYSS
ncbi:MAG: hypothetical protein HYW09_01400 [Candidatus Niyogibacteria bacterium]|nr:hypothetical protein [Candidatus Niyogibacteria bacterium]